MKVKILGAHQHLNSQPEYDAQRRQTGSHDVPLLEIIAIPAFDDPQKACCRINIQFYDPDDATLVKSRPGSVMDLGEITSAEAERRSVPMQIPAEHA